MELILTSTILRNLSKTNLTISLIELEILNNIFAKTIECLYFFNVNLTKQLLD